MKKTLVVCYGILLSLNSFGQMAALQSMVNIDRVSEQDRFMSNVVVYKKSDGTLITIYTLINGRSQTYKESPFFGGDWQQGAVIVTKDVEVPAKIRFNTQKNYLSCVIKEAGKDSVLLEPLEPYEFRLGDKHFLGFPVYVAGKIAYKQYYEVLYNGKTQLLEENHTTLMKDFALSQSIAGYDGQFNTVKHFYVFRKGNSKPELISLKKKSFFEIFGDKKADLEKYADDNKLNIKDLSSVVKIFEEYDALEK